MPVLYRDYETRSARNLKRFGSWKYAIDPATDVERRALGPIAETLDIIAGQS